MISQRSSPGGKRDEGHGEGPSCREPVSWLPDPVRAELRLSDGSAAAVGFTRGGNSMTTRRVIAVVRRWPPMILCGPARVVDFLPTVLTAPIRAIAPLLGYEPTGRDILADTRRVNHE